MYILRAVYFVPHNNKSYIKTPPLDIKKSLTIPSSFIKYKKSLQAHKIIDPFPGKRKDLIVMVKDTNGKDITYTFPESTTGVKKVKILIP